MSGTLSGAGGVRGLLMIEEGSEQCYPVYGGRENIVGLYDKNKTLVAWYNYDSYGQQLLSNNGPKAEVDPISETGVAELLVGLFVVV